jgi:membrane-bound lytic murein transglycosylase B
MVILWVMTRLFNLLILLPLILLAYPAYANPAGFESWKTQARGRFIQQNIPSHIVDRVLNAATFEHRVIELDRKQPEGRMTLTQYVERTVTPKRVAKGRALLQRHHALLQQVQQKYGVPPEIIIALWGKETDFGGYVGGLSTVNALATLAYEGRRGAFFESELAATMKLIHQNKWQPSNIKGSWAGAIGQCQFMPSNYLLYGVDGDKDGRVDLWNSMPDIFYSMGNLLASVGWDRDYPWGQRLDNPQTVRLAKGYSLYQPDGSKGPSYTITSNFAVLKRWNNSGYFATAVGRLADKISQ